MKKKRIFLIDGPGFYYRAFYGIKANLKTPEGVPVNAVYGFARMFMKIIRDERPDFLVIAMDSKEKTFRHEMYGEYKANRQKMPEELSAQIPIIERMIETFGIPVLKMPGLEADDLIGTAAVKSVEKGLNAVLVSGDKDLMQLVNNSVKMFDPLKEKLYDEAGVEEKFGVPPASVVEMLGLMGDSSDNIPGVPGVGPKTALKLLKEYGDIETILSNTDKITKAKLKESLINFAEQARLSRELARIKTDIEFEPDLESWKLTEPEREKVNRLFAGLGFKSMVEDDHKDEEKTERVKGSYKTILNENELSALIESLEKSNGFAIDTETTSKEPVKAELVGVSVSCKDGEGYYVPVGHDYEGAPAQIPKSKVMSRLKPLLENPDIEKYGQNIKYDMILLEKEGININPVSFDTMIASYLLNAEERRHNLSILAEKYLGHKVIEYSEVAGKGVKEIPFNQVEIEKGGEYSAEDADITFRLTGILKRKIEAEGLTELFYGLEIPLIKILAGMEKTGIGVDVERLRQYSIELEQKLKDLELKIYEIAGEEFNIASPKQLSVILFDKLGLPKVRKTKTGASTDQKVLETLAETHPLPAVMLEHRKLSKLKSTYVDPLPKIAIGDSPRIHTSFNQAMAATGRLSSSSPNLQNIPIRTEEGKKIREAFCAGEGKILISADYSQIELRLLAHLSGDPLLTESFHKGEDVHARTAKEVFGQLAGESEEMRRIAKAVNFSIIYGKTAFGLAADLRIPRRDAADYIENYFSRYRGVFNFIEESKETARKNGFVSTMAGRKRYLPDINSKNRTVREMAERMAVNTIVQGSAADLIKKSMIDIDKAIQNSATRMLLQVHDELIFETEEAELKNASQTVANLMESAWELSVPLKTAVNSGKNWGELH